MACAPPTNALAANAIAVRQCTGQGASLRLASLTLARPSSDLRLAISNGQALRAASPALATGPPALAMHLPIIRGGTPASAILLPAGAANPRISARPPAIKTPRMTTQTHPPAIAAPQMATRTRPSLIKSHQMTPGTPPALGTIPLAIDVRPLAIASRPPVGGVLPAIEMPLLITLKRQPASTRTRQRRCMAGARLFAALRRNHGSKALLARQRGASSTTILATFRLLTSRRSHPCRPCRAGARKWP